MTDKNNQSNRREFFRGIGRNMSLAGMAVLTALLIGRRRKPLAGQTCINKGLCCNCRIFQRCELPAALSVKDVKKHGKK
ncbi:MAG: hypothetical protein JW860_09290 [Sedimentisphaerales bacterium]|nr:hypothetical protein [Sedimentisphaerales bacterium]